MNEKYIFVNNSYKISYTNNSIIFTNSDKEEHSICLRDIAGMVIDNDRCTITTTAISKLAEGNKLLFVTNSRHNPVVTLLPNSTHTRASEKIKYQISRYMKQDALWKKIIRAKISNQIEVLERLGFDAKANRIKKHLDKLKTIDQYDPIEAYASREFFSIYPQGYRRHTDEL